MNKTRLRKQPTPFNKLPLREQWRDHYAKKSLIGFNSVFGFVYNPIECQVNALAVLNKWK